MALTTSERLAAGSLQIVTLRTHCRIGMASLAGLQVPPGFRCMIGSIYKPLRVTYRHVRFDFHAALVRYLAVAVRAITRLMAAITALGVRRRFYGMDGDKVGTVRRGHGLTPPRQAFLGLRFNRAAFMAIEAE